MLQSQLFYNSWEVVKSTSFFLYMIIGGRGIGKTYSTLKGLLEDNAYFMYIRRTESELETSCTAETNPFNALNDDMGYNIQLMAQKKSYLIVNKNDEDNPYVIGLAGALSTFGKFRGSDFSKVEYIIFDEFINTSPINTLKHEDNLFFNMLETVQRNREINGQQPIKIIMLSNANTVDNGIINALHLGEVIRKMKNDNEPLYIDTERSIYLELPTGLGITESKKKTALYKLTKGTDFYNMSIGNDFVDDDFRNISKIHPNQLIPCFSYDELYFYNIKGSKSLYLSYRKHEVNNFNKQDFKKFKKNYGILLGFYIENNKIVYYDYDLKLKLKNLF